MVAQERNHRAAARPVRIELVDNWHRQWGAVLGRIEAAGDRHSLLIDADGWLSARQSVLAAFFGERVVGHLAFQVQPVQAEGGRPRTELGRVLVEASLDSFGADAACPSARDELRSAAQARARSLRCRRFRGLE